MAADCSELMHFLLLSGCAFGIWICFAMEDFMNLVPQSSNFHAWADDAQVSHETDLHSDAGIHDSATKYLRGTSLLPTSLRTTSLLPTSAPLSTSAAVSLSAGPTTSSKSTSTPLGLKPAGVGEDATVFIRDGCKDGDLDLRALRNMPMAKVKDESSATYSFGGCMTNPAQMQKLATLPMRSIERPYLIWTHGLQLEDRKRENKLYEELTQARPDFVYINMDLRDPWLTNDTRPELPGVTMAPPKYFMGKSKPDPDGPTAYFAQFRGTIKFGWYKSSSVRPDLERMFTTDLKEMNKTIPGVAIEMYPQKHHYNKEQLSSYFDLLNTTYGIVPHGDGRWNYRFSEVVGACAIPVMIADGLSLPFSQIIDWSDAVIWIPESKLKAPATAEDFLSLLPHDEATIKRMRNNVCKINKKYFKSAELRWKALIASVEAYTRLKVKQAQASPASAG